MSSPTVNKVRAAREPEYGSRAYAIQRLQRALSLLERAREGGALDHDAERVETYYAIGAAKACLELAIPMLSRRKR